MEKRVRVIDFGKKFGNMNTGAKFYPDGMSLEDRKKDFLDRRIKVGEYYGFDGHKMYCCDQLTKNGSSFEITEDYVRENPNGWSDIKEDILIITDKVPGVVIGHPIADCPVVMMTDHKRGISAIAHCGAELIDKKLPMMIADSLVEYGCRDEDIYTYVSACAGKD